MNFKRARNDEQRTERRRKILDTAAAMLTEMPVAKVSLNELSRRVCLAKSNVLRYFESREAVLLELLDAEERAWLAELEDEPAATGGTPRERGDRLARWIAESLGARPILCDLLSAQATVLEHNVSTEVAARYKRASLQNAVRLAGVVRRHLPELGDNDALRLAAGLSLLTGSLWSHTNPSPAMIAAYDSDPALTILRLDFTTIVSELARTLISGLLARDENLPLDAITAAPTA